MERLRPTLRLILPLLLSGILLYLAVRQVDGAKVWQALGDVRPGPLLLAELFLFANLILRGRFWAWILGSSVSVSTLTATRLLVIGYMANNLLPLRLGELVRAGLMGKRAEVPSSLALGSIVLERTIDIFFLLVVALLASSLAPRKISLPDEALSAMTMMALALLIVLVAIAIMLRQENVFLRLEWLFKRLPPPWVARLRRLAASLSQGMAMARSLRRIAISLALAGSYWFLFVLCVHYRLIAMGIHLPLVAAALLVTFINVGTAIPAAPGALGAYHFAVVLSLGLWGIPKEESLACGVLFHALDWVVLSVMGALFLTFEPLGWRNLRRTSMEDG